MATNALECVRLLGMNSEVHQAVGMISVQIEDSVIAATMRLLAEAEATGRSAECVAAAVVARRTRFAPIPSRRQEDEASRVERNGDRPNGSTDDRWARAMAGQVLSPWPAERQDPQRFTTRDAARERRPTRELPPTAPCHRADRQWPAPAQA